MQKITIPKNYLEAKAIAEKVNLPIAEVANLFGINTPEDIEELKKVSRSRKLSALAEIHYHSESEVAKKAAGDKMEYVCQSILNDSNDIESLWQVEEHSSYPPTQNACLKKILSLTSDLEVIDQVFEKGRYNREVEDAVLSRLVEVTDDLEILSYRSNSIGPITTKYPRSKTRAQKKILEQCSKLMAMTDDVTELHKLRSHASGKRSRVESMIGKKITGIFLHDLSKLNNIDEVYEIWNKLKSLDTGWYGKADSAILNKILRLTTSFDNAKGVYEKAKDIKIKKRAVLKMYILSQA